MTTVSDLLGQIDPLWQQLKAALALPDVPVALVSTPQALTQALGKGGSYVLAPGLYPGNFTITQPTLLAGPREAIVTPLDRFTPPLVISASDVTLTGFTVRNGAPDRDTIIVGDVAATDASTQPSRVTLDSLLVEAGATGGHRGIALHGAHLTVKNCRITGFYEIGRDAQGIWIHNGPGPYTVTDNYVEASGENILTGGATIAIKDCVPSDILIARNVCFKPEAWRTIPSCVVKNGIELKEGRRVLVENNLVDGNWASGQNGTPYVFTVRNQYGDSPWVILDEVIVRGNRSVRCREGFAIAILGRDSPNVSQQTQTFRIEQHLASDSPDGIIVSNGVTGSLVIDHNTFPAVQGSMIKFSGSSPTPTPLTYTNNVTASGAYGFTGDGTTIGPPTLAIYTKNLILTGNVIELTKERTLSFPAGNTLVPAGGLAALLDAKFKLITGTAGW